MDVVAAVPGGQAVRTAQETGLEVVLLDVPVPPDVDGLTVPLIAGEVGSRVQAAHLVERAAPGPDATVRMSHEGGAIRVTVTSTAPTRLVLPRPSAHYGLVGLRQRAALLGGTVPSGPTADGGYELRLELQDAGTPRPAGYEREH
ncbi:hypothetical protein ABZ208_29960 [Streptomyces sp. NPDC006208]|uniref:hypothetical protein n=1 Tax=Streptomyces sp. NPDC006208 TaxID=3156734 RepID=UPI0033BD17ED